MDSPESPKQDRQATGELRVVDESVETKALASLLWDVPPLGFLSPEQQVRFKNQAQIRRYTLGGKIWSTDTPREQFVVVAGKVRLREGGVRQPLSTLEAGAWFGDLLKLSGSYKAVASGKDVVVVCWQTLLWEEVSSPELERFW